MKESLMRIVWNQICDDFDRVVKSLTSCIRPERFEEPSEMLARFIVFYQDQGYYFLCSALADAKFKCSIRNRLWFHGEILNAIASTGKSYVSLPKRTLDEVFSEDGRTNPTPVYLSNDARENRIHWLRTLQQELLSLQDDGSREDDEMGEV